MNDNPFSLIFGKEPSKMISRQAQIDEMVETFQSDTPSTMVYLVTGVRGAGKTVTMMSLVSELNKSKKWITVTLNPQRDLLQSLVANLYEHPLLKSAFAKIDLGVNLVVNASLKTKGPEPDADVQLKKMFRIIKKMNLKVLVAIDEAARNENMRIFSATYQMLISEGYPIYLVMTGLYENIRSLQDDKSLTFLYRAPRIELKPLSITGMANSYKDVFGISENEAGAMARFTMGYSYAFQVLGYIKYKNDRPLSDMISEFEEIMEEYSYEKIWSELSDRDKEIISILSKNGKMKVKDIQETIGMSSGAFSTYRQRLGRGGIISTADYGYCEIMLPQFAQIVNRWNQ